MSALSFGLNCVKNMERKIKGDEEIYISDSENSTGSEEGYVVEKIIDKKIERGVVKYLLKWKNWAPAYNSWEPESNLDCFQLIQEFEEKLENEIRIVGESNTSHASAVSNGGKLNITTSETPNTSDASHGLETLTLGTSSSTEKNDKCHSVVENNTKTQTEDDEEDNVADGKSGFELGLQPEKIVGASDLPGKVMLLMRWQNGDLELISTTEAKQHCPQLLIDFYETHLSWRED